MNTPCKIGLTLVATCLLIYGCSGPALRLYEQGGSLWHSSKAPFAAEAPCVLVVYKDAHPSQLKDDLKFRRYLRGNHIDFRFFSDSQDVDDSPAWVQEAYALPRDTVPFMTLSNGTDGYQGPELSRDEAIAKLEGLKK